MNKSVVPVLFLKPPYKEGSVNLKFASPCIIIQFK